MFIGEAPGKTEDRLAKPFIGRSGQLLNKVLSNLDISSFCIANVVCCIPWQNNDPSTRTVRQPTKDEAAACSPHLTELLAMVKPKVIFLLGKVAQNLIPKHATANHTVYPLAHPAFVLRNGGLESLVGKRFILSMQEGLDQSRCQYHPIIEPHFA